MNQLRLIYFEWVRKMRWKVKNIHDLHIRAVKNWKSYCSCKRLVPLMSLVWYEALALHLVKLQYKWSLHLFSRYISNKQESKDNVKVTIIVSLFLCLVIRVFFFFLNVKLLYIYIYIKFVLHSSCLIWWGQLIFI